MPTVLHHDAGPQARQFFTRYVFCLWLAHEMAFPLERLAELPHSYYAPVGPLNWLPLWLEGSLLTWQSLFALRMATIVACVGALFARSFRLAAPIACLLITLEQSLVRSYSSFMNHAELNLLFAAYLLTAYVFADDMVGDRLRKLGERQRFSPDGIPLLAIACVLCVTYYLVGVTRMVYGGPMMFFNETIVNATLLYTRQPWFIDFDLGEWLVQSVWVRLSMKVGFAVITLMEILAPFALIWPRFRRWFVVSMLVFHVAIIVAMKVPFIENMFLLLVLTNFGRHFSARPGDAAQPA